MPATKEQKKLYDEAIRRPKEQVDSLKKQIKEIDLRKKRLPNITSYYNLEQSCEHLDLIMLYINMNDASVEHLNVRNTAFLENARKEYYKAIQMIEEVIGSDIERTLAENRDFLDGIEKMSIRNILHISRKFLYVFDTLKEKMGESSKWKWSFVDLHVRIATMIRNMINFSELEQYRNFKSEYFQDREDLLKLCKNSLEEAAKEARNKYEMSTQAPEDIKKAVDLLSSLRNIHVLYAEAAEAQKTKTVIDALRARLEAEEKKKDAQKKAKPKKGKS